MAEFLGIVLVFGFFVGLWRAGFNAGLACAHDISNSRPERLRGVVCNHPV